MPRTAAVLSEAPCTARKRRWYRGPIVWGRPVFPVILRGVRPRRLTRARPTLTAAPGLVLACALLASGCGGGAKQNAHEAKANYRLDVIHASFPHLQSIARHTALVLTVLNRGTTTAPNVAVTIDSFEYASNFPELASDKRPIWIVDAGPGEINHPAQTAAVTPNGGGQTAYVNTWALGPLAPGGTRTFRWLVAPVKSGLQNITYRVAAGLGGNARAVSATGGPVQGHFAVYITQAPPPTQVNPNTGQVVPGTYPQVPPIGTPQHPLRSKVGAHRSSKLLNR